MKQQLHTYLTIPNLLTTLRIALVPVFVFLLLQHDPACKVAGVFVFAFASLTDIYDGYHARKYGETTRLGAFLDPLADKLLITAAFLLYVWLGYLQLWMVLLVVVRDVLITGLRIYAEMKDKPVVTSLEAKYKTLVQHIFVYAVMFLVLLKETAFLGRSATSMISTFLMNDILNYLMLAVTVLTVYTGISYLVSNWKIYSGKPFEG